MNRALLEKYDVPAPRYTSYPTVPYWNEIAPTQTIWLEKVNLSISENREISLYIHLPFCEQLCTYCACNKRITKNHQVETPYIDSLLQEWKIYTDAMSVRPALKTIHIGGGTPTFFTPQNLRRLFEGIFEEADVAPEHEFSFEAHPNNTTKEHLKVLHQLGFNRISIGVQDVDQDILNAINRKQRYEDVVRVTEQAKIIGYQSINFDLVFGLPFQNRNHIIQTMKAVKALHPDRIAFYSYAHVPWKNPSQRAYSERDLPMGAKKRALYELGKRLLERIGYKEIGMDHFALEGDELYEAAQQKTLHRNFMGYTNRYTDLMIGLGASSISDSWTAFVQNEKKVENYQASVAKGVLPIIKGHLLAKEDKLLRKHILNLSCQFEINWTELERSHPVILEGIERLRPLERDGLVTLTKHGVKVTEIGRSFIRNICLALDARYWAKKEMGKMFSQAV